MEHACEQERARKETAQATAAFRCHWLEAVNQALAEPHCRWLSAAQKKEIIDAMEVEIEKRKPRDSPRMATILVRTIAALIERYEQERKAQKQRQGIIDDAINGVSFLATAQERVRATIAVRQAIPRLDADVGESELRVAAEDAVRPIRRAVEKRLLKERLLRWAVQQLPWSKTELDALRVQRECAEILDELPEDVTELEGKASVADNGRGGVPRD